MKKIDKLPELSEHSIQQLCINYLKYKSYFVMRLNSGAIRTDKGNMVRMARTGTPDIMCFKNIEEEGSYHHNGCVNLLFIEVKRPGNKPTFAQEQMMKELEEKGGQCYVIHNLEELQKIVW